MCSIFPIVLHFYNILLIVKYFYSRTKCAFVLWGEGNSQQGVPGGGGVIERIVQKTLKPINIKKLNSFLLERLKPNHKETAKFCQLLSY